MMPRNHKPPRARGRPVELPDAQRIIIRLSGEQLDRLDAAAERRGVTRSEWVRAAIEAALRQR